jgi:protein-S-isoprenylcysteine O-methyltransferase Ste14
MGPLAAQPVDVPVDYFAGVHLLADLLARAIVIVLFSMMCVRFAIDFFETGRITGLFLMVSEGIVVALTLVRRSARTLDRSVKARILTTVSVIGPPLLAPALVAPLAPEVTTVAISCAGLAVVIAGKITLGRSFALLPANRGIVSTGLYRFVRHPIYLGYLVTHVAYLAANPSGWNIFALAVADSALLARAVCEERTLAMDPAYRDYLTRVRWRVLPGIF